MQCPARYLWPTNTIIPPYNTSASTTVPYNVPTANISYSSRVAQVWYDARRTAAPTCMVVYFHGTNSNPEEARVGLPLDTLMTAGCVVVAAQGIVSTSTLGSFPWQFFGGDDDIMLVDLMVSCAVSMHSVPADRVFVSGFSAGGLFSTRMAFERGRYVAAAAIYSGGLLLPELPMYAQWPLDPNVAQIAPTVAFHGGPADVVVMPFMNTTLALRARINASYPQASPSPTPTPPPHPHPRHRRSTRRATT